MAVCVGPARGELDIKSSDDGVAPPPRCGGRCEHGRIDRTRVERRHSTRSALVWPAVALPITCRPRPSGAVRARMPVMAMSRSIALVWRQRRTVCVLAGALAAFLASAAPLLAHGPVPPEPPTPGSLLLGWSFEPLPTLGIAVAIGWWVWAVRGGDAAHPGHPGRPQRPA